MDTRPVVGANDQDPEALWRCVERELAAGHAIWLTDALLNPLIRRLGVLCNGTRGLRLPPVPTQPEWLFRARDLILALLALIVLSPLMLLLAILVKLDSPGPIFHTATVVGKGGRYFVWRKFRSMRVVPTEQDEAVRREQFRAFASGVHQGKVIDETRVTRFGAILRKYSLDELPQLWNVLRGDMAMVGPRPCLPYEVEMFPAWAARRFEVLPGLTGVWQIVGRSRVSLAEGLAMDVYYRYARSFRFDLELILKTLPVVLYGEGGK